jgi:hypothetical protein
MGFFGDSKSTSENVQDTQTSSLDSAQQTSEEDVNDTIEDAKQFIIDTLLLGLKLLIVCIISFLLIYSCKVAHANILPIDKNAYPYTNQEPKVTPIPINIFSNFPFSSNRYSMKVKFPDYKNTFVDGLLSGFRDYKDDQHSSCVGNFFISTIESTFLNIYGCYNSILSFFNTVPEFILVIFGPYITLFVIILSTIVGSLSFAFHWISNLPWLMKKNTSIIIDTDGEVYYKCGLPQWAPVRWKSPDPKKPKEGEWPSVILRSVLVGVFLMGLMTLLGILPIISGVLNLFCIISFFSYSVEVGNTVDDMQYSSLSKLFGYFFKYNKVVIMAIFSLKVLKNANSSLGSEAMIACAVVLLIIYFSGIFDMFVDDKGERGELAPDTRPNRPLTKKPDTTENCITPTSILNGKFASKEVNQALAGEEAAKMGMAGPINANNPNAMGMGGMGMGGMGMGGMGMGGMGMGGMGMGGMNEPLPGTAGATSLPGATRGGGSKKIQNIASDKLIKKIKTFNKKYGKFLV